MAYPWHILKMFGSRRDLPSHLNICMIAAHFPALGRTGEHGFIWPLARGLSRSGHSVTVLSWGDPEIQKDLPSDGVEVHLLGEGRGLSIGEFPTLARRKFLNLHELRPFDVVHSLDSTALLLAEMKKQLRTAFAFDVEATQMSQIFSILGMSQETLPSLFSTGINVAYKFLTTFLGQDRKLLKYADGVFVTSPAQRLALERYYLYPEMKTHLVPYGIEIGDLSPREKSDELKKKLNLPDNGQVVVTVSDMNELEEMKSLLRAFERVAIKKPSARLLVVGNGPLFKSIEFEALSLALGSRVVFTGPIPSPLLSEYISLADVFVSLSARSSGFEPSLLEAMAQKKVIIGSEVSPISALVEDGEDGFLIRPADVSSLSDLILQVFNGELDHSAIGERARSKVTKLFDNERMVKQTLSAYRAAMHASGFFRGHETHQRRAAQIG